MVNVLANGMGKGHGTDWGAWGNGDNRTPTAMNDGSFAIFPATFFLARVTLHDIFHDSKSLYNFVRVIWL